MKSYSLANRFLTILPWPAPPEEPGADDVRSALVRFPLVGLALGLILVAGDFVFSLVFPISIRNGILVVALIVLTGGRPLTAAASCAGQLAWDKEGAEGAAYSGGLAIGAILLLKFAALLALSGEGRWSALLLAPVLGRAVMAYLAVQVREAGGGDGAAPYIPDEASLDEGYATVGWTLAVCLVFGWWWGLVIALVSAAAAVGIRRFIESREGQWGGDIHSASGEVIETFALLLAAAWWSN